MSADSVSPGRRLKVATARWAVARQLADAVKVIAPGAVGPVPRSVVPKSSGCRRARQRLSGVASALSRVVRRGVVPALGRRIADQFGVLTLNSSSVSSSGLVASICRLPGSAPGRELQQPDGLLQLRRHGAAAALAALEPRGAEGRGNHRGRFIALRKCSPRRNLANVAAIGATISSGVPWASTVPSLMM